MGKRIELKITDPVVIHLVEQEMAATGRTAGQVIHRAIANQLGSSSTASGRPLGDHIAKLRKAARDADPDKAARDANRGLSDG